MSAAAFQRLDAAHLMRMTQGATSNAGMPEMPEGMLTGVVD
jgi:hypothetical protein